VDHEVEHDIDIRAAATKFRQPLRLDEERAARLGAQRHERRIEPLLVTHREDRAARSGQTHKVVGLLQRLRDRFFNEHVHARLDQRPGERVMRFGRNRDRGDIDIADELPKVVHRPATGFPRDAFAARGIEIGHRDQLDVRVGRQLHGVQAAEITGANHRCAQLAQI